MKYVSILLVLTAAFITVTAELPEFIHTCKRKDPKISDCVKNSILSLREKLSDGAPEFGIGKIDPMNVGEVNFNLGPGILAVGKNLQLFGLKNFDIQKSVVDIEADTCSFDFLFSGVEIYGNYEIVATIASTSFKRKGAINVSTKTIFGQSTFHGKKVLRRGQTKYYYPSMDMKLNVTGFELKTKNLFEANPQIAEVVNKLLVENEDELLASVLSAIEETATRLMLTIANNLVKHFTYDELFPES